MTDDGALWPHGEDRWKAHAADLNRRVSLLQIHVEPRWLFALCTQCGWDYEATPADTSAFRWQVAVHRCPVFVPGPEPLVVESPDFQLELF